MVLNRQSTSLEPASSRDQPPARLGPAPVENQAFEPVSPVAEAPAAIPDGFRRIDLPEAGFLGANGPLYGKWDKSRFVLGLRVEERHCNAAGACDGGMLAMLADRLLSLGANLQGGLSRSTPTITLSCDFLSPAPRGAWIEGRVETLKVTASMVISEGVLTVDGDPVLRANAVLKLSAVPDPALSAERYFT